MRTLTFIAATGLVAAGATLAALAVGFLLLQRSGDYWEYSAEEAKR